MKNPFNTEFIELSMNTVQENVFSFQSIHSFQSLYFNGELSFHTKEAFIRHFDSEMENLQLFTNIKEKHIGRFKNELIDMIPNKFK